MAMVFPQARQRRVPVPARNDRVAQRAFALGLYRFPVRCECGEAACARTFFVSLEAYAEARRDGESLAAHG